MRAVLDVGQFVSVTINRRGHPGQILALWRAGAFELVTSLPILEDLRRVLSYRHIRRRNHWTDEQVEDFLDGIAATATLTPGHFLDVPAVKDDPTDDKVLACAVEASADYIVASDDHLAMLRIYAGIPIVRPRRFLEILEQPKEG
jgi:uncharacterized protein